MSEVNTRAPTPNRLLTGLLRLAFRLLYHELAWTYEAVAWLVSTGLWRRWREASIDFLPSSGRVLEIGAGTGVLSLEMTRRGWPVVALDRSSQMIRNAVRRFRRTSSCTPSARSPLLVRADTAHLPFGRECFAATVSTFPTEYILSVQVIMEAVRVLEVGGRFIIVPNAAFTGTRLPQRWARELFRVTRQAPAWIAPLVDSLSKSGLHTSSHEVAVGDSQVSILVGTKRQRTTGGE